MTYYKVIIGILLQLPFLTYGVDTDERVIGGTECGPNDHPNSTVMLSIHFPQAYCSGSIISPYHILTAAHCSSSKPISAYLGVPRRDRFRINTETYDIYRVVERRLHPKYNRKTFEYDIAVFEVHPRIPVESSDPLYLPTLPKSPMSGSPDEWPDCLKDSFMMGWGQAIAHVNDTDDGKLMCARSPIMSPDDCQSHYKETPVKDHICVSHSADKHACLGDSGGPIICNGQLVGVIAFGGCNSGAVCKWGSKQRKGSSIRCGSGFSIPLHHRLCLNCVNYVQCRYVPFHCAFPKFCKKGGLCPGYQGIAGPPNGRRRRRSVATPAPGDATSSGDIKFGQFPTVGIRTDLNYDFITGVINERDAAELTLRIHIPCLIFCTIITTWGFNI
ncbi:unnamed protein product [Callosobruchus maculatus]|uniref:Peptidase S1 domain-containing protein n=2 Tax=Callosobruchus maculatus TaxID=64391 RepID=A0A653D470_CALMS|nr:unnamed protein product [Callosobruchus maculatus]